MIIWEKHPLQLFSFLLYYSILLLCKVLFKFGQRGKNGYFYKEAYNKLLQDIFIRQLFKTPSN